MKRMAKPRTVKAARSASQHRRKTQGSRPARIKTGTSKTASARRVILTPREPSVTGAKKIKAAVKAVIRESKAA